MSNSYGLSPEYLGLLFPYHLVIDRNFKFVQIGPSVADKFDADIKINAYFDHFFELSTPASLLNWSYLRSLEQELCVLRHIKTKVDFTARVIPVSDTALLFIIKPLINTEDYLEQYNLKTTDFPSQDEVNDLFLHENKTKKRSPLNIKDFIASQNKEIGVIRNLLESQEAESRKLAHIISRSSYWVIVTDTNGKVEWVNAAFLENSAFSEDAILGQSLTKVLTSNHDVTFEVIRDNLIEHGSYHEEVEILSQNGHSKWIDIDVRPLNGADNAILNFIALGRDVTERKNAELLSAKLTTELNSVFTLSVDGFVTFDQNGKISQANQAFLTIFGFDETQVKWIDIEKFELLISCITQKIEDNSTRANANISILKTLKTNKQNELVKTVRRTVKRVYNDAQECILFINYFQDISHEYELSRMKGEFLSIAAHELRTPMSSIHGFSKLLITRDFSPEKSKEIVENIFHQSVRMTSLLNEILDLARIEAKGRLSFASEAINVSQLVDTALKQFYEFSKDRVVEFNKNESLVITGDFDKLMQVMINLLSNAHKYSSPDSVIKIELSEKVFGTTEYGGLSVIDAGIGMSEEDANKIFEPFHRAAIGTESISGTGLGMRIVKEIIDIHSGKIDVESQLNVGTKITCWIPK